MATQEKSTTSAESIPVTADNFIRAETDRNLCQLREAGCAR